MVAHKLDTLSRVAIRASGVVVVGALLASCGQQVQQAAGSAPVVQAGSTAGTAPPSRSATHSQQPHTNAGASATETSQRSAAVERCHTSMLTGSLRQGNPGAGQRYAELTLHNDSSRVCTVHGYPGLQLVGANGQPLTTEMNRIPDPAPEPVRLTPGESASTSLHWSVVPTGDEPAEGPCGVDPADIEVIPPDETDPLTVPWSSGPVCGGGSLDSTALH